MKIFVPKFVPRLKIRDTLLMAMSSPEALANKLADAFRCTYALHSRQSREAELDSSDSTSAKKTGVKPVFFAGAESEILFDTKMGDFLAHFGAF